MPKERCWGRQKGQLIEHWGGRGQCTFRFGVQVIDGFANSNNVWESVALSEEIVQQK